MRMAVFAVWLTIGLWNPGVGGMLGAALIGLVGLRYVGRFWRGVYRRLA